MTKEEIKEVAERFGETYNREGRGTQMAWAFESGAEWMKDRFEEERLAHCDRLTNAEAKREMDYVCAFIEKNKRSPTFSDAIESTRKQIIEKAYKWIKTQLFVEVYDKCYEQWCEDTLEDFENAMEE